MKLNFLQKNAFEQNCWDIYKKKVENKTSMIDRIILPEKYK